MSIFRFSNAGGFGTYQRYNDFLAGNPTTPVQTDFGAMFPLGEFTLASTATSVTFSNIPQTYKHLQIRGIWKPATTSQWTYVRFGNAGTIDTAANYSYHSLLGNGTSAYAEAVSGASATAMNLAYSNNTTHYASFVMDILDYRDTNKYKTTRSLVGFDANGSGILGLISNSWRSFNAVTDIRIYVDTANNISTNSQFALYGVL